MFFYKRRDIIESRHKFFREIRKYRKGGRPIIFLDETWANAHIAPERVWLDSEGNGEWKSPSGKGQRLIILHAGNLQLMKSCRHHYCLFLGSREGWIQEAELVFFSETKSRDYHDEMKGPHFVEWFQKQLLPNLPPHSVIVHLTITRLWKKCL